MQENKKNLMGYPKPPLQKETANPDSRDQNYIEKFSIFRN